MPIFEFSCLSCGYKFEKLCKPNFSLSEIECPKCLKKNTKKLFSSFRCKTSSGMISSSGSSCGSCSASNCNTCGH